MKTLILSMLVITMAGISYAQNVNIPDANFKNALISAGVDTNKDGEISYAEAEGITSLDVSEKSISDMTGIEAFVNLDTLNCSLNQLTSLDISSCTALALLVCNGNQLTSLDVSNNTALTGLYCSGNQLTSLDLSKNENLLFHSGYQLGVAILNISYMPALYKVCVSEMPFPPIEKPWIVDTTSSPNVYFSTDCLTTDLNALEENSNISAYPNPATSIITFDLNNISESAMVELFDLQGNQVLEQKLSVNKQISVRNLPEGLYMYKLNNGGKLYTGKLAVE